MTNTCGVTCPPASEFLFSQGVLDYLIHLCVFDSIEKVLYSNDFNFYQLGMLTTMQCRYVQFTTHMTIWQKNAIQTFETINSACKITDLILVLCKMECTEKHL